MKYKAYVFANAADYDVDDISEKITFAETQGKAKQDFSMENGIHYKDIRVQRLPWLTNMGTLTVFLPRNGFLMAGILFVIRVVKI